ncbi:hypothetical protein QBC32DRAFT_105423 [Pseudoneurospora amorphoporcata]|uniref:C2H2-type domain-containing protein n=1 Tax=Pseudoneurospora amorphoporcata TaxID=241081 RepID=A0AAN6NXK0_9PEZI|nr:hypothetical protein QBC32DRAFT_105423 [Pseudoneurospora amorphoporcata]
MRVEKNQYAAEYRVKTLESNRFFCEYCTLNFPGQTQLHIHQDSDKHRAAVKAAKASNADSEETEEEDGDALARAERRKKRNEDQAKYRAKIIEEKRYYCGLCNVSFDKQRRLDEHFDSRLHTNAVQGYDDFSDDNSPFQCKLCRRSFSGRGALYNHKRNSKEHQRNVDKRAATENDIKEPHSKKLKTEDMESKVKDV